MSVHPSPFLGLSQTQLRNWAAVWLLAVSHQSSIPSGDLAFQVTGCSPCCPAKVCRAGKNCLLLLIGPQSLYWSKIYSLFGFGLPSSLTKFSSSSKYDSEILIQTFPGDWFLTRETYLNDIFWAFVFSFSLMKCCFWQTSKHLSVYLLPYFERGINGNFICGYHFHCKH